MDFQAEYIFCSEKLIKPLKEVGEIFSVIKAIPWNNGNSTTSGRSGNKLYWQAAYNRMFEAEFDRVGGWKRNPVLCTKPLHKGDFLKDDVFVEVQFGNSSTIYRDYYKFHYGLVNRLLSLAVLIVPTSPLKFFPDRSPRSINNMASYEYALEHFSALTIPVPILLIGLMPDSK